MKTENLEKINSTNSFNNYFLIGILSTILLFISSFYNRYENEFDFNLFLILYIIGVTYSLLLLLENFFKRNFKEKYILIFDYFVIYSNFFLPFSCFFILKNPLSSIVLINLNLLISFIFLNKKKAILGLFLGFIFAIFFSKLIFNFSFKKNFDQNKIFYLSQSFIYFFLISFLFFKKESFLNKIFSFYHFENFFKNETIKKGEKSLLLIDETKKSYKKFLINPEFELDKIFSSIKDKNFEKIEEGFLIIQEFFRANKKELFPYYSLNPSKESLKNFFKELENMAKSIGIKNFYIENLCKDDKVSFDKNAILKSFFKIISTYIKFKNKNYDDDFYLNIIFKDCKIYYRLNENFVQNIDGISIVVCEDGFFDEKNMKNISEIDIPNPEKIPSVGFYEEEIEDIEKIILAHYGKIEDLSDQENFCFYLTIPKIINQIRPISLDLRAPIDSYYDFEEGKNLEKKLEKTIEENFKNVSLEKIRKTIDLIKIYHHHQTRNSGEPYYIHPINVALFLIEIAKERSKISEILNLEIENALIAALLHDILEDTAMRDLALNNIYGTKIVDFVKKVTKIDYEERLYVMSNNESFSKIVEENVVPFCIKLADRMHNILTIDSHKDQKKRIKIARETLDFFILLCEKFEIKIFKEKIKNASQYILENGKIEGFRR